MSIAAPNEVHVLAGVIFGSDNRVLLAQRPRNKELAGYWEFPGGKIESGESRYDALARELKEELGIEVGPARPLTRVRHAYPSKTVVLDFWIVRRFQGDPHGLDGQDLQWCELSELEAISILPADRPMLRLLRLPDTLSMWSGDGYRITRSVTTPEAGVVQGVLCETSTQVQRAAREGADFMVMAQPLAASELAALCETVDAPVFAHGVSLPEAWALGASGSSLLQGEVPAASHSPRT